ncbi:hypothetical protein GDO81_023436 [Engystomops pustulosus]|uniref:Uncharacterized protein n=1 Tax=Engystomops pustulosus TaxID=76066 RepID=A0AAV6Z4J7_ENGPU|nr:hypothetical protein GDO81_023436 [Engystomops pustulosus]
MDTFQNRIKQDLSTPHNEEFSFHKRNLSKRHFTSLSELRDCSNVVIKMLDKWGTVVLLDIDLYYSKMKSMLSDVVHPGAQRTATQPNRIV